MLIFLGIKRNIGPIWCQIKFSQDLFQTIDNKIESNKINSFGKEKTDGRMQLSYLKSMHRVVGQRQGSGHKV
jgi:hypothetical protein